MALMNDLSWVPALRTEALTLLFTNITLLGYQVFLFLFLSFGFYFWRTRIFYQAGLLLFFTAGVNLFLKDLYQTYLIFYFFLGAIVSLKNVFFLYKKPQYDYL